jgi:hypothetical protein
MASPSLSVIVVVHNMPRQAMNTLASLATPYQKNISAEDYEIIVVENASDNNLEENAVTALGDNFRYFLREEPGVSPVPAVNFAFQQARGEFIGLIIDGARMVTPRVLEYALLGFRISKDAMIMVPGYHLGKKDQKFHLETGHAEEDEIARLEEMDWQENGYRLFQYAAWSSSNQRGYFQPMQECNCLFTSAKNFEAIGKADERFDHPGGGSINLHIYRSLGMLPQTKLFVLPGEGSFHQFHHGVTTQQYEDNDERQDMLKSFDSQLDELWPEGFKALTREPMILGAVTRWAQPFLAKATELAQTRFERLTINGKPFWDDDEGFDRFTENEISVVKDGYAPPDMESMKTREADD